MNCIHCGAFSLVKETRDHEHGLTRRRRECANGHRFNTYEVYEPTVRAAERDLAATARRAQAAARRWARDRKIILSRASPQALAAEHGLTDARVRQIRAAARTTHPHLFPSDNSPANPTGPSTKKGH